MLRTSVAPYVVAAFLIIAVTGCEKNSGEAMVLTKEHIDAALLTAETPTAQSASSPDEQLRPMKIRSATASFGISLAEPIMGVPLRSSRRG